jgi:hypothetical protein
MVRGKAALRGRGFTAPLAVQGGFLAMASRSASPAPTAVSHSRRALLAGALGAFGAAVAGAVARVSPVHAADGDPVLIGAMNSGAGDTYIHTTSSDGAGLIAICTGDDGAGLVGRAVHTTGSTTGVLGEVESGGGFGVMGACWSDNGRAVGVYGVTSSMEGTGVHGAAVHYKGTNVGVLGESLSRSGIGVHARATKTTGVALQAAGRVKFSTSGVASIPAGASRVTVTPGVAITPTAFVLLTPKVNLGGRDLWFTTNVTTDKLTIRISSARSTTTPIAWMLVG